jgi:ABC-type bacteriocin/lantibiotic exporter with double-glycine peptidase domain
MRQDEVIRRQFFQTILSTISDNYHTGMAHTKNASKAPSQAASHGAHGAHGGARAAHHHPANLSDLIGKLFRLLTQEKRDLWVLTVYAAITGVLSLVVPLSSQAIVNAVQFGVVTTQLIVLCVAVGLGMLVLGVFMLLESYLVDILQRRLFVRAAFDIAARLRHIKSEGFLGEYPPEVVNRFFDVLTIQKSMSKILLDGLSASLVALVGLLLLGIYHPIFLIFDIILVLFVAIVAFGLSRGGIDTSIKESKKKYALVQTLEDIARCQTSFKLYGTDAFILHRVDHIAGEYVLARKKHFRVLARQLVGSTVFRAIAMVGVLGLGGFLVIDQSLSIGQLVAAEIVIISVLNSVEKLISQFEQVFDLLTAIDKMAHITDKPLEPLAGETPSVIAPEAGAATLVFDDVTFAYPHAHAIFKRLSFSVAAKSRVSLIGASGAGKTTVANLLVRLYEPQNGRILLNGHNIAHIQLDSLRSAVSVIAGTIEIFTGTIRENITIGREFSDEDMTWALKMAQMYDDVMRLPHGLETSLEGIGGDELSESLLRCITVARAIIGRPRLIVTDDVFSGLTESLKIALLDALYACPLWTIVDISHDPEQIRRADTVFTLDAGAILEQGHIYDLAHTANTRFTHLFPRLTQQSLAANGSQNPHKQSPQK